jgi:acyl carrier protein
MTKEARTEDIVTRVTRVIAAHLKGIDPTQITPGADFIKDLGADSLDVVQLIIAMEEEFDLGEIPDEDAEGMRTVQDVIDYLVEKLDA